MKIAAAACRSLYGIVHSLPPPARHHDVIWVMRDSGYAARDTHDQGFITDDGMYVDRITAKVIARNANQILEDREEVNNISLFSEEVWKGRYTPPDLADRSAHIKRAYQYVNPNDQM